MAGICTHTSPRATTETHRRKSSFHFPQQLTTITITTITTTTTTTNTILLPAITTTTNTTATVTTTTTPTARTFMSTASLTPTYSTITLYINTIKSCCLADGAIFFWGMGNPTFGRTQHNLKRYFRWPSKTRRRQGGAQSSGLRSPPSPASFWGSPEASLQIMLNSSICRISLINQENPRINMGPFFIALSYKHVISYV